MDNQTKNAIDAVEALAATAHVPGPKELIYNAQMQPLLKQLMQIADENNIDFASTVKLDEHEGKGLLRSSCVHGSFSDREQFAFELLNMVPSH